MIGQDPPFFFGGGVLYKGHEREMMPDPDGSSNPTIERGIV